MKDKFNVAVVGATGMVGETMLDILAQRRFPVAKLHALASERSLGKTVRLVTRSCLAKCWMTTISVIPILRCFLPAAACPPYMQSAPPRQVA
jgi:aspartate-semialdehyde dehydrogenase